MNDCADQNPDKAAARVMKLAEARRMTLATAESCTAGSLAHLLSETPGATKVLHGGFIVYTKDNKTAALGVPKELIATHTAVSGKVASAMAKGALQRCPADIAAAVTGVAGPMPDEDGNPVGLVYVAAAARDGRILVERHEFGSKPKDAICHAASVAALGLIEQLLEGQLP